MRYATIQSWSFNNKPTGHTVPIDFYLDLMDNAKQTPSLEQAVRQAANRLNQLLFPLFQFKVDVNIPLTEKTRHIKINNLGCNAELGARESCNGNKYAHISCYIGAGWRGDWKTHNVDSIIHELFHALGRFHEQQHPDSFDLIQSVNFQSPLPSENFLECYDPFSLMHYSLSLINVVIGERKIAPQTTIIKSLTKQGYAPKLAMDLYEALLGLNENHFNWDAFNLGFGLLTRRDFSTLRKTACIIDSNWCGYEAPIPLFAFTRQPKLSYHYLLKLTKIFAHPHYQKEKLIVIESNKTLEIKSHQCYIINLNDFFQVYPKVGVHCKMVTSISQETHALFFSNLAIQRQEKNSCILRIKKGFFIPWKLSSIQSEIIFYSNDTAINVSSTLQWQPTFTENPETPNTSSLCVSIPNNFFNTALNKTTLPFLNSEVVSGSYLDFYERNKYFFKLALNAIPFFSAGLIMGITNRAEWAIFSYHNENPCKTGHYLKYLTQGITFFISTSLTSYALYQHIIEEKARQLIIPLLDENKQLFQTADLMDRLNNNESCLALALPYGINAITLLTSALLRSVHQHPMTQWGITHSLSLLIACMANQTNTYSHLELAIGVSLYLGGSILGYSLTSVCLFLFVKLKLFPLRSQMNANPLLAHDEQEISTSLSEEAPQPAPSSPCPTLKSTSVIKAIKHAWDTVTLPKFAIALRTSFFTGPRTLEENNNIKWSANRFERQGL